MSLAINYVPTLTTLAGSCLTTANWSALGVDKAAFCLASLCIRPGPQVLMEFNNLRHYCAWPGKIILNLVALLAAKTASGDFKIRSPYDGSYFTISIKEVFALIDHLQPDYVVLPDNQWVLDFSKQAVNWQVLQIGKNNNIAYWVDDLAQPDPCFPQDMTDILWLESDRPAADAMQGIYYGVTGNSNILDTVHSEEFIPLVDDCACPTCQQGLTRAYLHHLLQHTPLLAQRFLIAHNVMRIK